MLDLNATLKWTVGVLKSPDEAAREYAATDAPFIKSFLQLVLPLYVVVFLVSSIVSGASGSAFSMNMGGLIGVVLEFIAQLVMTIVAASLLSVFAGFFGGVRNFNRAYALVALATIPALLGEVFANVPSIGDLVQAVVTIYTGLLVWKFLPVFLGTPTARVALHFVATVFTLVPALLCVAFLQYTLFFAIADLKDVRDLEGRSTQSIYDRVVGSEAQAEDPSTLESLYTLMQSMKQSSYEPPEDGKVTRSQIETYLRHMAQVKEQRLQQDAEEGTAPRTNASHAVSSDDRPDVWANATAMRAEFETVVSAGGNWEEHVWVKVILHSAKDFKDSDDAGRHNYQLFLAYQQRLEALR